MTQARRNRPVTDVNVVIERVGGEKVAAELAEVGVTAVHNWLARGEIPATKRVRLMLINAARRGIDLTADDFFALAIAEALRA